MADAEVRAKFVIDDSDARRSLERFQQLLGRVNGSGFDRMGASANAATSALSSGTIALGNFIASMATRAIDAFTASLDGAVARVDTMNNFPRVMQNLGYSAEDAAEAVSTISDRLQGLPTTLDDMVSVVQSLVPITGDMESATEIGLAFNDMLVASGKSASDQSRAMLQYSQMLAKGLPDMQSWRTLMEVMPGQLNQVAQALLGPEANAQALYEAMQKGEVTFEDFNDAILRLDSEGIDGLASFEEQARGATSGIQTSITNMHTAVTRGVANIIDAIGQGNIAGAFKGLTQGINDLFGWIRDLMPDLLGIASAAGEGLAPLASLVQGVMDAVREALEGLVGWLSDHRQDVASFVGGLADGIRTMAGVVGSIASIIGDHLGELLTLAQVVAGVMAFNAARSALQGFADMAVGALGRVSDGLLDLATNPGATTFVTNTLGGMSSGLQGVIGTMGAFAPAIAAVAGGLAVMGAAVFTAWSHGEQLEEGMRDMRDGSRRLADAVDVTSRRLEDSEVAAERAAASYYSGSDAVDRMRRSQEDLISTIEETNESAASQMGALDRAMGTIEDYAGRTDLTEGELAKLRDALEEVNEQCGTQYELMEDGSIWDDETESVLENTGAIEDNVEARRNAIQQEAILSNQKAAYEEQSRALQEMSTATREYYDYLAKAGTEGWDKAHSDELWAAVEASTEAYESSTAAIEAYDEQLGTARTSEERLAEAISNAESVLTANQQTVEGFEGALGDLGLSAESFSGEFAQYLPQVAAAFDGTSDSIENRLATLGITVTKDGRLIPTNLAAGMKQTGGVRSAAEGLRSAAGSVLSRNSAQKWGQHLASNFASGIRNGGSIVEGAASALAQAASRFLKHSVPEAGPLSDDDLWGAHLVQNIIGGMRAELPELSRMADTVAQTLSGGVSGALDPALDLAPTYAPAGALAGSQSVSVYLSGIEINSTPAIRAVVEDLMAEVTRVRDM